MDRPLKRIEKKINVIKPLKIRKPRPTSRYLPFRLYSTGPQSAPIPTNGDAARFAREDDHMSNLLEKVNELGTSYHHELEHRLKSNLFDASEEFIQLSNHLGSFNWKTPPVSPALMSDGSFDSPESPKTRRKKQELQKILQEKALKELIASDKKYHDLENNLTALKEWWSTNRVNWVKQRDVVEKIKFCMESLHIQKENADGDVSRAQKDFSYHKKYDELKHQLMWFDEHLRLMKAVKEQCRQVQGDIVQEEKIVDRLLLERRWSTPQGFSFIISPQVKADVTKALWWSKLGRGFPWWLQAAHDFMKWNISSLRGLHDDFVEEKIKCELKLGEKKILSQSRVDSKAGDESVSALRDVIVVLHWKHAQLNFGILDVTRRIETHEAYFRLLKRLLPIKGTWYTASNLRSFVNNVHLIFYLLMQEMEINRRFVEAAEDEALSLDESISALTRMEDHFAYNGQYYRQHDIIGDNIVTVMKKTRGPKEGGLMFTVTVLELMIDDYEAVVKEVEDLVAQNEAAHQRLVELQDIRRDSATLPPEGSSKKDLWGSVRTMQHAYTLLLPELRDLNGKNHPTWAILRMFFVSPDICPSFYGSRAISSRDFVNLANSFLQQPLESEVFEAFVYYCQHEADELFYLSLTGKVCAQKTKGWELVDEMEIRGPRRRLLLRKPPRTHHLSHWMVHNQRRFSLVGPNRNVSEKDLLAILNKYYPTTTHLTLEDVQEYLSYFSQAGLFYKYAPKSAPNGEPILTRIDNGWYFDPKEEFYPLFDATRPIPAYFQDIQKAYNSREGQARVYAEYKANPMMTVSTLYDALKPELGRIKPTIKEHRFILWVRWCDQNGDLFQLHRNGELDFIDS